MKKIISNIAMMNIYTRRDGPNPAETTVHNYEAAVQALNDLAAGVRIFGFVQTQEAGLPKNYEFQSQDFINNNMVTARWLRMFGLRQDMRRKMF
jgi:hypothetical protein